MNYQETIDYLFTRLPMFSRIGDIAYKKDLTNTIALCSFLGDPHKKFKSIHIAGTNGKGSVSHMLAAILQKSGFKTGLYTSPHLKDFRERIKVDGVMVDESFVINFTENIKPQIEVINPSFFEITVAMAFAWFAEQRVDIAVIETGLGGRLDSTNIIFPELSVITNIGRDHMQLLGDTLPKIAFEKAGIIKPGITVVVGEFANETAPVFEEQAALQDSTLTFADKKRFASDWHYEQQYLVAEITETHNNDKHYYRLDLPGVYQLKNLVTVLETVHQMRMLGWTILDHHVDIGLQEVKKITGLHGRWEQIGSAPKVVLDVAHNEQGMEQLARQIELTDHEMLHIVIGMVKDKEVENILSKLPKHAQYYFTKAQIPRALHEDELAAKAQALSLSGDAYQDVNTALHHAISKAGKQDLVIVCGSVFVVGEVER